MVIQQLPWLGRGWGSFFTLDSQGHTIGRSRQHIYGINKPGHGHSALIGVCWMMWMSIQKETQIWKGTQKQRICKVRKI